MFKGNREFNAAMFFSSFERELNKLAQEANLTEFEEAAIQVLKRELAKRAVMFKTYNSSSDKPTVTVIHPMNNREVTREIPSDFLQAELQLFLYSAVQFFQKVQHGQFPKNSTLAQLIKPQLKVVLALTASATDTDIERKITELKSAHKEHRLYHQHVYLKAFDWFDILLQVVKQQFVAYTPSSANKDQITALLAGLRVRDYFARRTHVGADNQLYLPIASSQSSGSASSSMVFQDNNLHLLNLLAYLRDAFEFMQGQQDDSLTNIKRLAMLRDTFVVYFEISVRVIESNWCRLLNTPDLKATDQDILAALQAQLTAAVYDTGIIPLHQKCKGIRGYQEDVKLLEPKQAAATEDADERWARNILRQMSESSSGRNSP